MWSPIVNFTRGVGAGSLDREEVRQLLKMCSTTSNVSKRELDSAMKRLDADGSGEVDLEEFQQYFTDNKGKVRCLRPLKICTLACDIIAVLTEFYTAATLLLLAISLNGAIESILSEGWRREPDRWHGQACGVARG